MKGFFKFGCPAIKLLIEKEEIEIPILSTNAEYSLVGMELFYEHKIVIERQKDIVEITKI